MLYSGVLIWYRQNNLRQLNGEKCDRPALLFLAYLEGHNYRWPQLSDVVSASPPVNLSG